MSNHTTEYLRRVNRLSLFFPVTPTVSSAELERRQDDGREHEDGHDGGLVAEGKAVDDVGGRAGLAGHGNLTIIVTKRGQRTDCCNVLRNKFVTLLRGHTWLKRDTPNRFTVAFTRS